MFKGEILRKAKYVFCVFTVVVEILFFRMQCLTVSTVCKPFCIFYKTVAGFCYRFCFILMLKSEILRKAKCIVCVFTVIVGILFFRMHV